jgi:hypothetical protein
MGKSSHVVCSDGNFEHGKALPATKLGPWSANLHLNGTKLDCASY